MRKGIAVAGNMILDKIFNIEAYPTQGELATITSSAVMVAGGAVCNDLIDLAKLDKNLPLTAIGIVGEDEDGEFLLSEMKKYKNIDLSQVSSEKITSYTLVLSDNNSKQRTFFQYRGANAFLGEKHFNWENFQADILHIGYILLLDELDKEDSEFGTKLSKVLFQAQQRGIQTSIDVVSEKGNRFQRLVTPALKYTDYCIINELEAQATTGIALRENDTLVLENMPLVLNALKHAGVRKWAVIHCPEISYGIECESGKIIAKKSLRLKQEFIKGTTGAGDAYCSGILYGAYKEMTLEKSMEIGTACAALSLSAVGATDGVLSFEECMCFYKKMK